MAETQQQQPQQMQERRGAGEDADADATQLVFMIAKSFNCLIPILINVVQMKYSHEGKDESPFETHPATMWVFVFSTFIYFSAAQRSVSVAIISGSLSSVSLVSVLLPRLLGTLIFIIACAFVTIIVAYQVHAVLIHYAYYRLHQTIKYIISSFSANCKWFTPSTTSIQQRRLPV
ncbi:hypothetical protein LWI28_014728 [Acer negundo]|uniref:Uncharacterized protein n=1 Tax=Acer negundo TaxID=4023 RepID=A0AAD5IZ60_ACENE|nr:hypothetical protein LWI28_014728 [Acer negundo]KAK4847346.1 hypothetical protein QYF36_000932 [Acer negundo]